MNPLMKLLSRAVALSLLTAPGCVSSAQAAARIDLKVLYAGVENEARTGEFMALLKEHFTHVGFASYTGFQPAMADDYQVVVFDAPSRPTKMSSGLAKAPKLPKDFNRASVLIGAAGIQVATQLRLKLDWMCLCLEKRAHDTDTAHAIFKGPLKVDIKYEDIPMPSTYIHSSAPGSLPKTLRAWKVGMRDMTDTSELGPGIVSDGYGFEDSPDAEVISGGVNHKGMNGVAIGRHGPFLLWGFEAGPGNLTEPARNALINSIAYAAKFDRAPILVRKSAESRERTIANANLLFHLRAMHEEQSVALRDWNARGEAMQKKRAASQPLTAEETRFLERFTPMQVQSYEQLANSYFNLVPAAVRTQCKNDPQAIKDYYQTNLPYLVSQGRGIGIDEDARALGIPNNDVRILDRCIELLGKGEDRDRALRVLSRYTGLAFTTAVEWKEWLDSNRTHLFFSDVGGYKFFSDKPVPAAATAAEPTADEPATWAAGIEGPGEGRPGSTFTLTIDLRLAKGWHVYDFVPAGSPYIATMLDVSLPPGAAFAGEWVRPEGRMYEAMTTIIEEGGRFTRSVKVMPGAKGKLGIPVTISWQACDQRRCLPPDQKTLLVEIPLKITG